MKIRIVSVFLLLCLVFASGSPCLGKAGDEQLPDDFKRVDPDYVLSGWTVVNEGNINGPSAWFISNGVITQSSNLYGGNNNRDSIEKPGTYALNGDMSWTDYTMSVELRSRDDDSIGIMFRYQDKDNYYRFSMDQQRKYRRLVRKVKGKMTVLAEDAIPYKKNQWYTVKINVMGPRIEIYIDDRMIFGITDESIKSGQIGLYTWGNGGSDFRKLLITLHSGWVIIDEGTFEAPSQWSVKDGVIDQASNISGGNDNRKSLDKPGTYVINGDSGWTDYELDVSLASKDDDAIGVMFRYQDPNNYYLFVMDRERKYRRLVKKTNGENILLAEDSVQYEQNTWYQVKIKAVGRKIMIMIDDAPVFEVEDDALKSGKVCLYCWGNEGSTFKDLVVTPLDAYEDVAIKETEKVEKTEKAEEISPKKESPPSPDEKKPDIPVADKAGQSDNYVETIEEDYLGENYIDFLTAENVEGMPDAQDESKIKTHDAEVITKQTGVQQALPEDWQVVDDGEYDRPSLWSMTDDVIYQKSNIYGGSDLAVSPVKPGTHLVSGESEWKDYIFTGMMLSSDDDAIGVIFRYQDENNYYRFSMDSQRNYRRLIKKVDGYVITLAEDSWTYEKDRWYAFKIIVVGKSIKVHMNGQLVFDVQDDAISSGKVGRYCWGNEGGAFKDFSVTPVGQPAAPLQKKVQAEKAFPGDCERLSILEQKLNQLKKEVQKFRETCNCGQ
ncbi:MAG: DUF1080 domain-containing protein [Proteobacteria bacterium]|nr:DUF1080 domain-containing protein [Pseudomonadota bacterium]